MFNILLDDIFIRKSVLYRNLSKYKKFDLDQFTKL